MTDFVILRKESSVTLISRPPAQVVIPGSSPPSPLVVSKVAQSLIIQRDGIPGIAGEDGADGVGLNSTLEFTVTTSGAQFFLLSGNVNMGILHVNGLFQPPSYYSINSSQLSLPSVMGLITGDVISFSY